MEQHRSRIRATVILCQLLWTLADRLAKFSESQETLFLARQKSSTDCFIALCRIVEVEKWSKKWQTLTMRGTLFLDPLKTATYYYDRKDWYSTNFFLHPPNWTKLNLTFIEQKPKLSEQSLPHQWRFTRDWNISDWQKGKRKKVKVRATLPLLSLWNTSKLHCGKNNVWILQFAAPPLPPSPADTEAWRPPHLAQTHMILSRAPDVPSGLS